MDLLSFALGCLAGAAAAVLLHRRRKVAVAVAPVHPRTRLYDLANAFTPTYQASARPEDLLDLQGFQDGVRLLSGPPFTADDLIGYLGGDNSVVTTMSARALTQRGDADERVPVILDRLPEVSLYAAAHLLPLFERSSDPHVPVKILLRLAEHWQNALGQRLVRAYLPGRLAPEAVAHFRAELGKLEADHAKFLREAIAPSRARGPTRCARHSPRTRPARSTRRCCARSASCTRPARRTRSCSSRRRRTRRSRSSGTRSSTTRGARCCSSATRESASARSRGA
jgi:hypothetical protein